jgi:hypothetical protein
MNSGNVIGAGFCVLLAIANIPGALNGVGICIFNVGICIVLAIACALIK